MRSKTTVRFRSAFADLPEPVQRQARAAYRRFQDNHQHPGLQFKRIHPGLPVYSVRVGLHYRAVGTRQDEVMIWFWIGAHADYDKLIRHL